MTIAKYSTLTKHPKRTILVKKVNEVEYVDAIVERFEGTNNYETKKRHEAYTNTVGIRN